MTQAHLIRGTSRLPAGFPFDSAARMVYALSERFAHRQARTPGPRKPEKAAVNRVVPRKDAELSIVSPELQMYRQSGSWVWGKLQVGIEH